MNHYLVTAIVDFAIGFFAYRRKESPASKALAFMALSLAIWSMELYFLSTIKDLSVLHVCFHLTRWGMFLIAPSFAYFSWKLMRSKSEIFLKLVVVPGFAVAVLLGIANTFFFPSTLIEKNSGYLPKFDAVYFIFVALFLWCFVGSIVLAAFRYRGAGRLERQKIKWLLITLTFCLLGGISAIFFMASGLYLSKYTGSILNILFIVLLFYSTIQYRLLDFRFVLSVGIAKAVVLAFFSWSFLLLYSLLKSFDRSGESVFVFWVAMVLMLESYPRVLQWLVPNARKLIVGTNYDIDEIKVKMQIEVGRSSGTSSFFSALNNLLINVVRVKRFHLIAINSGKLPIQKSEFVLEGSDSKLSYVAQGDPVVTLLVGRGGLVLEDELLELPGEAALFKGVYLGFGISFNGEPIAALLLGKPEYSYYRYDDINLFEWLQMELGQALHRIIQLEEMHDQLGQAKKTLSMLGVMNHYHHDIKAPLAIIDGVLSNDIYDKEKQRDIVLQQVERGSRLIATMAGILKGERRRRVREVSLEQVVKDSLFLFGQGIDDIYFELGNVPNIRGDAEDLKILVINLAKNAMEARYESQKLYVTVKTWFSDGQVFLSVKDTGVGMEKIRLELIWDNDTDSLKLAGNGIGLQAIKRISDEHGARVEVKSEVGIGTEFIFCFPESIVCRGEVFARAEAEAIQARVVENPRAR